MNVRKESRYGPQHPPTPSRSSLWSTHKIPRTCSDPFSVFSTTPFIASNPTTSGRLYFMDWDWEMYWISLVDLSAHLVESTSSRPSITPWATGAVPPLIDENDEFFVLVAQDYRTLFRFNLRTGQWFNSAIEGPYPTPRALAAATICSSSLYISYGLATTSPDRGNTLDEMWRLGLTPSQGFFSWELVAPRANSAKPLPRSQHRCFSRGNRIYLHGGYTHKYLSDTWEFDPATTTWRKLACSGNKPSPRNSTLVDDTLFVLGDKLLGSPDLTAVRITPDASSKSQWFHLKGVGPAPRAVWLMMSHRQKIFFFKKGGRKGDATVNIDILDTRLVTNPTSGQPLIQSFSAVKASISYGDFHLIEKVTEHPVGRGGFCEIFIGRYSPTQRKLALKRPWSTEETHLDAKRRFYREAKMWSTFDHPNILPFLGIMETEHYLYLLSPWMEFGDLAKFVRKRAQYSDSRQWEDALTNDPHHALYTKFNESRAIREIAAGLSYLHGLDIIHGDIKANNILIAEDGRVVLCDFGLSKALHINAGQTSTAMKGIGTLRWQSPERFLNESKSSQSDVYAFAMTIAEILTGSYPLPELTDWAFLVRVVQGNERPPFEPRARLGVDFLPLWDVASRSWAADPRDRPSMDDNLHQLSMIKIERFVDHL